MISPRNPVLLKMLDRLFAAMVNGPAMNCRPHASRQRIDLTQLARLAGESPGDVLHALLGDTHEAKVVARVPPVKPPKDDAPGDEPSPEERAARAAWADQQALLGKLRVIADEARTYEQDTGVHVLDIGFPLLSLPPGTFGAKAGQAARRVLAPVAFVPVTLTVKTGAKQVVEIACRGEGVDLVRPNTALLAWLEQQTGRPFDDLFDDAAGENPWKEITALVRAVADRTDVPCPALFGVETPPDTFDLLPTPKADNDDAGKAIVCSAVVGLFPTANQGLLRDSRDMVRDGVPDGPIAQFLKVGTALDAPPDDTATVPGPAAPSPARRSFADERLISRADPCQTRAVRLARACQGLVVHGPPGTGKSQTIANVIGDHLARGQRVLFVCDKRTALDVVADRLHTLGLGDLLATVHDAQRDQRELYRSVREQLEGLADAPLRPDADAKLRRCDEGLQQLHDELSAYYRDLMGDHGGPGSFHDLVGQWLADGKADVPGVDERTLQKIPADVFDRHGETLRELLERGERVRYADNPWTNAAGVTLAGLLATPAAGHRAAMAAAIAAAEGVDATNDPHAVAFSQDGDPAAEAARQQRLAAAVRAAPTLAPDDVRHWAGESATIVADAVSRLRAAASDAASIARLPPDATMAARAGRLPAAGWATVDGVALRAYASAFDRAAARVARLTAGGEAVALRWALADPARAASARKRLDAVASLSGAVAAAVPDASLLARFAAAAPTPAAVTEWSAALNDYLAIAGHWTALFRVGKKKAAAPVVRAFGLSLTPESAATVRDFLGAWQQREDLRSTLAAVTGETVADADEEELIALFRRHHAALKALDAANDVAPPATPSAAVTAAINGSLADAVRTVRPALDTFELPMTPTAAVALADYATAVATRESLADLLGLPRSPLPDDATLAATYAARGVLLDILGQAGPGSALGHAVADALANTPAREAILTAMDRSPDRAAAIVGFEKALGASGLPDGPTRANLSASARAGRPVLPAVAALTDALDTLEGVLRVREGLAGLPSSLAGPAAALLAGRATAGGAFAVVHRNVLAGEIGRRLRESPRLLTTDAHRLQAAFDQFAGLSEQKKGYARDEIIHRWTARQKERLLAATGNRLNGAGADLRRRLTLRGERAMRLRQVIAHGRQTEGGDPLFDLRPVWLASPETVAQLFAREPIFDVIVFDEASQCRLEEALPVLTRGRRLVIAGDPKQLPPTRFFESAVATSEEAEADTEQALFEAHQGEVEDLLTASLGVDGMTESYLNVHYRSRNSGLIEFSNTHFYGSRLQAIPGRPLGRTRTAPITLCRADGVYEKRRNAGEADAVCRIVQDLLAREAPRSIGIACFNTVQRDLIVETLESLAAEDAVFAGRLATARERRGQGSSEGLFVKNLENVQGDERDHLIISTTYGPDKTGKFRRNFGPLGMAGGGRRLNVLVTRAREAVHVVTSVPRAAYAALPDVPPGTAPGGVWLLFAYLRYAESLATAAAELPAATADSPMPPRVVVRPSKTPSRFAEALADRLAAEGVDSDVHWGNEGFCVDLVPHARGTDAAVAIQCDLSRFTGSDDPVEWDVFQNAIHRSQGWMIRRVWTPHFYRDPDGRITELKQILAENQ